MKSQSFEVYLETDLLIKSASTVEGQQPSLDYLPGRLFLCLAASKLYGGDKSAATWDWFHSGKVRFSDGLPVDDNGELGLPSPLCLHEDKERPIGHRYQPAGNLAAPKCPSPSQWRSLKGQYLNNKDQQLFRPAKMLRLKNEINTDNGRVGDAKFFATQAIRRDQRFRFDIHADDDLDDALWQRLLKQFAGSARLGGSRSAEFGRVRISQLDRGKDLPSDPRWAEQNELCLWLLSDAFLSGSNGDLGGPPALEPHGIKGATICWERSFLEHHTLARYNAAYQRFEREQYLTKRGSVLVYSLSQEVSNSQLAKLASHGIGFDRHQGLGRVWVNPTLLLDTHCCLRYQSDDLSEPFGSDQNQDAQLDTPLAGWLVTQADYRKHGSTIEELAAQWSDELKTLHRSARQLEGADPAQVVPSARQWGLIREAMRDGAGGDADSLTKLRITLFDQERGICSDADRAWGCQVHIPATNNEEGRLGTFGQWLQMIFDGQRDRENVPPAIRMRAIGLLARRAITHRRANRGGEQKGRGER